MLKNEAFNPTWQIIKNFVFCNRISIRGHSVAIIIK